MRGISPPVPQHVFGPFHGLTAPISELQSLAHATSLPRSRFVTFDGLVRLCAEAAGAPEPELVHFDPKAHDLGKAKAFPLRDQHFFTSIAKVRVSFFGGVGVGYCPTVLSRGGIS